MNDLGLEFFRSLLGLSMASLTEELCLGEAFVQKVLALHMA